MHRFVLVFYVLSIWHTLILGLDVSFYGWIRPVIWLAQIPLLILLIRRLIAPLRSSAKRSSAGHRALATARYVFITSSLAGIALIAFIVISGNSAFIKTL